MFGKKYSIDEIKVTFLKELSVFGKIKKYFLLLLLLLPLVGKSLFVKEFGKISKIGKI